MPNKVCKGCDEKIYWSGVWGLWMHLTSLSERCKNKHDTATPKES